LAYLHVLARLRSVDVKNVEVTCNRQELLPVFAGIHLPVFAGIHQAPP
jgi:hypothetical protein